MDRWNSAAEKLEYLEPLIKDSNGQIKSVGGLDPMKKAIQELQKKIQQTVKMEEIKVVADA